MADPQALSLEDFEWRLIVASLEVRAQDMMESELPEVRVVGQLTSQLSRKIQVDLNIPGPPDPWAG